MKEFKFSFPIFLKQGNSKYCIISRIRSITVTQEELTTSIEQRHFNHTTVAAFEEFIDGNAELITEQEFHQAFLSAINNCKTLQLGDVEAEVTPV